MNLNSPFLQTLQERGFINQCTDFEVLDDRVANTSLTAYVGFDCTAPSLHIGNLISIMMLRWWQKMGHRPIILLGGATTRIGDPSGKEEMRKLLDKETIEGNIQRIEKCFRLFLRFDDSPTSALLVNNREWLDGLNYIDFLRDYGRHFSLKRMLNFDSVKLRLERKQSLSFLEFNYMIFQAYDFLELSRQLDCVLQMGGADQWGNIVSGVELAHKVDRQQIFGLTSRLITTESGQKMGKTADGAVWLDDSMSSSQDYWQYWRNIADEDVGRFLRLFTELPLEKISKLEKLQGDAINKAKIILADEVTTLLHGKEALKKIHANLKETQLFYKLQIFGANLPKNRDMQRPKTRATRRTYKDIFQVTQKQTDWLEEILKQTEMLPELEKQTKLVKKIQETAEWLHKFQKQETWIKEFQKQEDWLENFQKQAERLKEFQKQADRLKEFRTQNLLSFSSALLKQASLLNELQKQKDLLDNLQGGTGLLDTLRKVGLADSNSEARRFVRHGAVRINGKVIKNEKYILTLKDSRESDGNIHLSIGKKRHHLLRLGEK